MGFIIMPADDTNKGNIVNSASRSCFRVTRSIMEAELIAHIEGFDVAYIVKDMIDEILGNDIPMEDYLDRETVLHMVGKDANTSEKRLLIYVHALRESKSKGELRTIAWIPGESNVAHPLTKRNI